MSMMDHLLNTTEIKGLKTQNMSANDTKQTNGPSYNYAAYGDLKFYVTGIFIPIGILTNILTIIVILRTPVMRKATTGLYLISLAMADTTVLCAGKYTPSKKKKLLACTT